MTDTVQKVLFRRGLRAAGEAPVPMHFVENQPPYRFTDRVLERNDEQTRVLKNITRNEWCLVYTETHGYQFPRCMILECMAQAAGTYDEYLQKKDTPVRTLLSRIKEVEFFMNLTPGDQLIITARLLKVLAIHAMYDVQAHVAGELAAKCKIFFARV